VLGEKLVDPLLEAAAKDEMSTEDFVLTEEEEEDADGNA
jgi:hypothetical protein